MPWLVKTEPDEFSFADLLAAPAMTTAWEGVRNYQARNFLREMRVGEPVLVYHSSTARPGVAGLARVARESYPDPTQFDAESGYFDPKATRAAPRWDAAELQAVRPLTNFVTLTALKAEPALQAMRLLKRGNRLSVIPVSDAELGVILRLAEREEA